MTAANGRSEWFSTAELAGMLLHAVPETRQGVDAMAARENWRRPEWESVKWRPRQGRGGGIEYHYTVVNAYARAKILGLLYGDETPAVVSGRIEQAYREQIWERYRYSNDKQKAAAAARATILREVEAHCRAGMRKHEAVEHIASIRHVSGAAIHKWFAIVRGYRRDDWWPLLIAQHKGRSHTVQMDADAWEMLKADYLRPEQPNFSDCWERVTDLAKVRGWTLPSERTALRSAARRRRCGGWCAAAPTRASRRWRCDAVRPRVWTVSAGARARTLRA